MKRIILLGATGSIGSQTAEIALKHPDKFYIEAIVANSNVEKLASMAVALNSKYAVIRDTTKYQKLKELLSGTQVQALAGDNAISQVISKGYDIAVAAVVGFAGIKTTFESIRCAQVVAIANKESMVCAGEFIKAESNRYGTTILPIDSEHTALMQILEKDIKTLRSITITASGGALRDKSYHEIANSKAADALKHPNWSMGNKITIDSATLANKGLEIIEAIQFFDLPKESIEVVIHRESIIHAVSSYVDGSSIGHMGYPDMKTAISYAINQGKRIDVGVEALSLAKLKNLTFEEPDLKRFPMLKLAFQICDQPAEVRSTYNLANEIAVQKYLNDEISFYDIYKFTANALEFWPIYKVYNIADIKSLIDQQLLEVKTA